MYSSVESLGKLLRYYRQEKGLRQDDVATGLCTVSYLSRIENGVVVPDYPLFVQLFERVGINLQVQQSEQKRQVEVVERIYEALLSNEEISKEDVAYMACMQHQDGSFLPHILTKIVYARYLLSIKEMKQARRILQSVEPLVTWRNDRLTQLYIAVMTYARLSFREYDEIVNAEQEQPLIQYLASASTFEQANYQYHLAFANSRCYRFQQALFHIEEATRLFSHQFKPLFQLKLYSMKGVIFNSLSRYPEALAEYEAGLDLMTHVQSIQSPAQWSSLYNNIAFSFESQGQFEKALHYYSRSVECEEDLHTVINWMRACYRAGQEALLKELLANYSPQLFTTGHHRHQRALLNYASMPEKTITGLKEVENKAFHDFEKEGHYELLLFYAPLWARHYEELHAYKQAAACYQCAFQASEMVRVRMSSYGDRV